MKMRMKKVIEAKEAKLKELREKAKKSESVEELRALNEDVDAIIAELNELKEMYGEMDEPAGGAGGDGGAGGEGGEGGARSGGVSAITNPRGANPEGNDAEKRAQNFVKDRKTRASADEVRAVLLGTGSIAKPTEVGGINDPHNTVSSLVDQVKVEDMTGMGSHKEAYVKTFQTAGAATDGTASTPSDPVFRTAMFSPFLIDVLTYVSREIRKQTPLLYEQKVREGALIALRKKVNELIVTGNGTTAIYGIYNAVNTENTPEPIYDTLDLAGDIGADTLRKIVFAYGGDENVGGNARLYLSKTDLIAFGDVRGTNEKKAVYEITPDGSNPNTGVIKDGGLSVPYTICSNVTSYKGATATSAGVKTMCYGDPNCYKLGLHGDFEINESEDYKFAEGLLAIRGEVMVSGNLIADKGMLVVLKKTAAAS